MVHDRCKRTTTPSKSAGQLNWRGPCLSYTAFSGRPRMPEKKQRALASTCNGTRQGPCCRAAFWKQAHVLVQKPFKLEMQTCCAVQCITVQYSLQAGGPGKEPGGARRSYGAAGGSHAAASPPAAPAERVRGAGHHPRTHPPPGGDRAAEVQKFFKHWSAVLHEPLFCPSSWLVICSAKGSAGC